MTVYVLILLMILGTVYSLFKFPHSRFTPLLYLLATVAMIACAGLRSELVGRDYVVYRDYFSLAPQSLGPSFIRKWLETLPNVDLAYVYLNSLFKVLNAPFEALIFFIALMTITMHAVLFRKTCPIYPVGILIYYTHWYFYKEMIQIRAGLAGAVILWAFYFLTKQVKWKGYCLVLLGILLHMSMALVLLPLLWWRAGWKIQLKYVLLTLFMAIIIGSVLNASFPLFSVIDRLAIYQDSEYSVSLGIFRNPVTVKQIVVLVMIVWTMRARPSIFSGFFRLGLVSYWFATLWIIIFNQFEILGARGASALSIAEPFLIAELLFVTFKDPALRIFRRLSTIAVLGFALTMFTLNLQVKMVVNDYESIFK